MVQYTKLNSHKLLEAPELKILLIYSGLFEEKANYNTTFKNYFCILCYIIKIDKIID